MRYSFQLFGGILFKNIIFRQKDFFLSTDHQQSYDNVTFFLFLFNLKNCYVVINLIIIH